MLEKRMAIACRGCGRIYMVNVGGQEWGNNELYCFPECWEFFHLHGTRGVRSGIGRQTLETADRESRLAGMSYGEYQSRKYLEQERRAREDKEQQIGHIRYNGLYKCYFVRQPEGVKNGI